MRATWIRVGGIRGEGKDSRGASEARPTRPGDGLDVG